MSDKPSILQDFKRILFLNCVESSKLNSESLDRRLRWSERVALKLHYIGCWSCRRLSRQLKFLRETATRFEQRDNAEQNLSDDAAARMKEALTKARDAGS